MPNLRSKTWTTTTPAYAEDAQYWEDHLISDADAAKIGTVILPAGGTAGQVLTKQSSTANDATWEEPASSGHTIVDEDDTDMPYRTNLQFLNADVTDDSANDATVVDCKGSKGDPGQAATITVGTVTTLPAGSNATVTNSGTSSAAVFDFGIPKGADGSGSGDMLKADYDPNSVVELAGGIPDYVASQAYTLPTAASNVLGGVKVGTNLSIDASGVLSATDTNTDALHDLTDVNISLPSDGQALLYDSTNNKWVNGDVAGSASDITYDNTDSGLTATDVQDALDEIETNVETKANSADVPLKTQISNPNLLDNPFFTVNQRGQNSYTDSTGYCVDRWCRYSSLAVTVNVDGSITITNNSNAVAYFGQRLPLDIIPYLKGRKLTLSAKISSSGSNSIIYAGYGTSNDYVILNTLAIPTSLDIINVGIDIPNNINDVTTLEMANISIGAGESITVYAFKLEVGDISTLALDTAPNYATELLKCQRYFVKIPIAIMYSGCFNSTTQVKFTVPTGVKMRTTPIITGITKVGMSLATGVINSTNVTAQDCSFAESTGIGVRVTFTSATAPTQYAMTNVQLLDNVAYASADL